jgi:hypothetical protein
MTNRKNYNSIVFFTTLSVYLGLVLVGTPPILAQAALTQKLEIQNEAEIKDDLDKKPDDEIKSLAGSTKNYFEELEDFIQDLQKLHSIEKFDLDDEFRISQLSFVPCNIDGDTPIRRTYNNDDNEVENRWLVPAFIDETLRFEGWNNFSDCQRHDKYKNGLAKSSEFKLKYDKSTLEQQLVLFKSSPQRAEQLAGNFNRAFESYELNDDEIIVSELHKNTSFSFKDTQVFIVTRLPRASIDELLAKKDAQ